MNPSQLLENVVVVLVRPHYAGNLGAVARVMRNMGVSELVLVDPVADSADREARKRSTHGEAILNKARIVPKLSAALAGCLAATATSARGGELIRSHAAAPAASADQLASVLHQGKAALVFGPEPSGLTNEEISLCQHLICIPADESYPALNLAQSAAICLYELRVACLRGPEHAAAEPPAPLDLQERMFLALEAAFTDIHYLYGPRGPALMHGIRRLIGRAAPTEMEVKLLLGLARQIRWFAGRSLDRVENLPESAEKHDWTKGSQGS